MTKEEALDLIPLYAMGLLEDSEAQALEQFLAQAANSSLRVELQRYQAVTEALPLLVKAVPAPDLEESLRQRLAAQNSISTPPAPTRKTISFWQERRLWGAVAVLVMVLGLGFWWGSRADTPAPPPDATLTAREKMAEVLANPNTRQVAVNAADEFANISGNLFIDHNNEYGVLQLAGITPLPEQQAYQLWLMSDQHGRYDAGVFNSNNDDHTVSYLVELPPDFGNYQGAGVTIEPASGSPDPTGDLVLSASLKD